MSKLNQSWFTQSIGDADARKATFRRLCVWRAVTMVLFVLVLGVAGMVALSLKSWVTGLFLLSWIGLPAALYVGVESRLRSLTIVEYMERKR